jgi:hypothetical protein
MHGSAVKRVWCARVAQQRGVECAGFALSGGVRISNAYSSEVLSGRLLFACAHVFDDELMNHLCV